MVKSVCILIVFQTLHGVSQQNPYLTLSWRRPLSYRNQSINLLHKSIDWLLYDNGLRHERVKLRCRLGFSRFLLLIFTFLTVMAEKKKKLGEDNILSKKELIFQKLSSESKTTTTKFTREGPIEFVEYNFDEI